MDKLLEKLYIARKNSQEKHMSFAYIDGDVSIRWDEIIDCITKFKNIEPIDDKDNSVGISDKSTSNSFYENGYKKY